MDSNTIYSAWDKMLIWNGYKYFRLTLTGLFGTDSVF